MPMNWSEFFNMGGYALYVWTSYGLMAIVLLLNVWLPIRRRDGTLRARADAFLPMDMVPEASIDRKAAMKRIPSLIKAYLRLGGCVGEGAYLDRDFNTIDVCLLLDMARLNDRPARIYGAGRG